MENTQLFCLPYSGASCSFYYQWKARLKRTIKVCPVELPGRGFKSNEKILTDINKIVDAVFSDFMKTADAGMDYCLLGHSLGGLIVYELYHRIKKMNYRLPAHIFISGYAAPHLKAETRYSELSDADFWVELKKLGGVNEELLSQPDYKQFFINILRADFGAIESFSHGICGEKIDCDITIFYGAKDHYYNSEDILAWREYGNKKINFHEYDEDHFFIHKKRLEIIDVINATL